MPKRFFTTIIKAAFGHTWAQWLINAKSTVSLNKGSAYHIKCFIKYFTSTHKIKAAKSLLHYLFH